jgi:bifunctional UDP-N-acetylglucosamine pyrophosphorylase / glucosamine-1-phosphate N-acetyltransferase
MNIVILAAGQGKRMGPSLNKSLPKVLHLVAGRPMLAHVLAAVDAATTDMSGNVVVVVGHGAKLVQETFPSGRLGERSLRFCEQPQQLGTGHAVLQAAPLLDDAAPTLVLYGDVPLIRSTTLQRLVAASGDVALLTVQLAQPAGYGRIVRDWHGNVLRIVEECDADEDERKLTEVNTGILVAPTVKLKGWLKALSNNNAQREYYLTDVIAQAVAQRCRVVAVECDDPDETRGVNSKEQLATAERIAQRRVASAARRWPIQRASTYAARWRSAPTCRSTSAVSSRDTSALPTACASVPTAYSATAPSALKPKCCRFRI